MSVCCSSGRLLEEQLSLVELGVQPQGATQMEVSSVDQAAHPLRPHRPPESCSMPDVLTVRIQTGEETLPSSSPLAPHHPNNRCVPDRVFLHKTLHTLSASHQAACALPTVNKQHVAAVAKRDTRVSALNHFSICYQANMLLPTAAHLNQAIML